MIAVSMLLAMAMGAWGIRLRRQDEALSAEVQRLKAEWVNVSVSLREARRIQAHFQALTECARRVAEERGSDQRAPVLRSIAGAAGAGIDLRVIRLLKTSDDPRALMLRLEGVSIGTAPRQTADQFFQKLKRELAARDRPATECRLERLDDETDSASATPARRRATFTITAPIGAAVSQKAANPSKS